MSIKTLRESLCREQSRAEQWPSSIASAVDVLINMIDKHRPLGPNGKHGARHTPTCGCEDKPHPSLWVFPDDGPESESTPEQPEGENR